MDRRGSVSSDSSRRRCINCSLAIPRNTLIHSVESVHDNIREVLTSWITPSLVTPEHIICHNCYLLMQEGTIGSPEIGHQNVCFGCGVSLLRTSGRKVYQIKPDSPQRDVILQWIPPHFVPRLERACAACWRAATRTVNRQHQYDIDRPMRTEEVQTSDEPPSRITSSIYKRAASTANHCLFINCNGTERLIIPLTIREMALKYHRFYIPAGARICHYHLDHGHWGELTSTLNDFTGHQLDEMMSMMERLSVRNVLDFSNPSNMSSDMCHYWLGMSADQFHELLLNVPSLGENVPNAGLALSIFLIKLRTGDSNARLSTLFKMPRSTLERYMDKARECLINQFVPQYIGFNHMSVEAVAARNKIIPEGLFGNPELGPETKPAIIMCDSTYIFVQNSSNYKFQKNTYSLQKLDNLVKPFMLVCCDGHILDCIGPFKSTTNDPSITSLDLHSEEGNLTSFFRMGDIFILDRGFRDVITRLSINDLKLFALGTYQLKQAVSYYGEHVRQTGTYTIEINTEMDEDIPLVLGQNNYLLRGRIRSRHVNARTYFTYLLISKNQAVLNTLDAIVGYCCNCRVGRRTVGCCAHIMTVVWYLSWARYNDVNAPASYLDDFFHEYEE